MCGIFVSASYPNEKHDTDQSQKQFNHVGSQLRMANALRGPDAQSSCRVKLDIGQCGSDDTAFSRGVNAFQQLVVDFYASELRLRGDADVVQPHVKDQNILCWNGEIFDGIEVNALADQWDESTFIMKPQIRSEENDGARLSELLCRVETPEQMQDVLGTLEGPYAFIFYHSESQRLYFARDPLGRRSLLIHRPSIESPYFLLSSVSAGANPAYDFSEVSAQCIFLLDFRLLKAYGDIVVGFEKAFIEISRTPSIMGSIRSFANIRKVNTAIPPSNLPHSSSLEKLPDYMDAAVDSLVNHLGGSVMLQVRNIPHHPTTKGNARVAVLFSGGIDSAVIAYFAHKHISSNEPIDLLNVAFENPRKIKAQQQDNVGGGPSKATNDYARYEVPDRITGIEEVNELRRLCPGRTWNFVEINVPFEECRDMRPVVEGLMVPGRTVMDLSLALALYFASRGKGQIRQFPNATPIPYTSKARVLLNGLGSDELLGGYGRHRSVYKTGSWQAVISELQQEIDRLPIRNLGRDDRIMSSHGKEARHPFLSLTLVDFLASLPIHYKMDPRLDVGFGDKILLRYAARKIGLVEASTRKKRAMQFGSHSARMGGERRGDAELE